MSSTQEVGQIFGDGSGSAQTILRSPTVIIASIGLWGMNVFFFRVFGLDYVRILKHDLMKEEEDNLKNGISEDHLQNGNLTSITSTAHVERKHSDGDIAGDDYIESPNSNACSSAQPQHQSATAFKLVLLSVSLLLLLHLTIYAWMDVMGGGSIGAIVCFYVVVTIGIIIPLPSTRWLRSAAVVILQRAFELVNPRCSCVSADAKGPRPIPFIDVFFADAMCSLSKVFFDWGVLWHLASHFPEPVPPSAHSILIPSFCAGIPYLIRARQCLIMHTVGKIKNDPKRYQHVLNAVKYSSSIFPLCLSAYQQTVHKDVAQSLEPLLITLLIINTIYSLAWDIIMDWGMMHNPTAVVGQACMPSQQNSTPQSCYQAVLRPRLRFGVLMSTAILLADSVLRFGWTLRFFEVIFPSKDHFVLFTQFLEVFRRAIWNLLRVEWENIKQMKAKKGAVGVESVPLISHPPGSISMVPLRSTSF